MAARGEAERREHERMDQQARRTIEKCLTRAFEEAAAEGVGLEEVRAMFGDQLAMEVAAREGGGKSPEAGTTPDQLFFHVALTMGLPAKTVEEADVLVQAAISNALPPLLFASWTTTEIPPDEVGG